MKNIINLHIHLSSSESTTLMSTPILSKISNFSYFRFYPLFLPFVKDDEMIVYGNTGGNQ